MGTHFGLGWSTDIVPLLDRAGVGSFRDALRWESVETTKGTYEFSERHRAIVEENVDAGIDPFLVGAYNNPLYVPDDQWDGSATLPFSDSQREAYGAYLQALLEGFSSLQQVEVWNEPNSTGAFSRGPKGHDPEAYAKLLTASYDAVKDVRDATVVGGATSKVPVDWLESVFEAGGLDSLDVLSIHPYQPRGAARGIVEDVRPLVDLLESYDSGDTPLWITEIGWSTFKKDDDGDGDEEFITSERLQARKLVRTYVLSASAGIERVYWYIFRNDEARDTKFGRFGIVRHPNSDKGDTAPKPAYVTFATMTRQLAGSTFDRVDERAPVESYRFETAEGPVTVLWSEANRDLTVETGDSLTVVDAYGGTTDREPTDGAVTISVGPDPIYVHGGIDGYRA
jgi:hypothetical protein